MFLGGCARSGSQTYPGLDRLGLVLGLALSQFVRGAVYRKFFGRVSARIDHRLVSGMANTVRRRFIGGRLRLEDVLPSVLGRVIYAICRWLGGRWRLVHVWGDTRRRQKDARR